MMLMCAYDRPWLGLYSTNLTKLRKLDDDTEQSDEEEEQQLKNELDMSLLPSEVIHKIFSYLEAEGLTMAAQVCRSWFVQAYEPSHWRRCAIQLWPHETLGTLASCMVRYRGWRRLVIERPRVLTSGIYVMRHSFVKKGVELPGMPLCRILTFVYYRLLRFYSDGVVVGLTTPENPAKAWGRLRRNWAPTHIDKDKAYPAVGRYEFDETNRVISIELPMFQQKYPRMRAGSIYYQMALRETHRWAKDLLYIISHWAINAGRDDTDEGEFINYDTSQYMGRPFRFVPIWGFRRRVLEIYPPVEEGFGSTEVCLDLMRKS